MFISLQKLNYTFLQKPIVVGGKAMEYYNLRKAGSDIDLIATKEDVRNLIQLYPERVKNLWGDLGVCPFEFEIWKTIQYFDYEFYKQGSVDEGEYVVMSLEKLLFLKVLAMDIEKNLNDVQLIRQKIKHDNEEQCTLMKKANDQLLDGIQGITYIQQKGPQIIPEENS